MIIVTGGFGMIGSNIVKALNEMGRKDILVVDNLKNGEKFINLVDLDIADYCDKISSPQLSRATILVTLMRYSTKELVQLLPNGTANT